MHSGRILAFCLIALSVAGCTTTRQNASAGFQPPSGDYSLVVMRPDVSVGLLTAGGIVERRQDWTDQASAHLLAALEAQQAQRGGRTIVAKSLQEGGADPALVIELNRLHEAVGSAIKMHKYLPYLALPTKKDVFDWTLGEKAVEYGRESGHDYALFVHAQDSFSSGGRVALQAMSLLGCAVGVCIMPTGGQQIAFASLVDLHTGQVAWFNFLHSEVGDIREQKGAEQMVDRLLGDMKSAPARR